MHKAARLIYETEMAKCIGEGNKRWDKLGKNNRWGGCGRAGRKNTEEDEADGVWLMVKKKNEDVSN